MSTDVDDRQSYELDFYRWTQHQAAELRRAIDESRHLRRLSVVHRRNDLQAVLRMIPSPRRVAGKFVAEAHAEAVGLIDRTKPDEEFELWPDLPPRCPYTLERILGADWWPERSGR